MVSAENEPTVAIDPTYPNRLLACFISNAYPQGTVNRLMVLWSYSVDGGTTWTNGGGFIIPNRLHTADPVAAFDSAGAVYVAGIAFDNDTTPGSLGRNGSIWIAKSTSGGRTFAPPLIVASGSGRSRYFDKPWIHVNPVNGHVYLAWIRRSEAWDVNNEEMTVEFARSTNGGATFSSPVTVSTSAPSTGTNRSHGPQISSFGTSVYVAWHRLSSSGPPDTPGYVPPRIFLVHSTDGGVVFGPETLVATLEFSGTNRFISLATDRQTGRLYVAYARRAAFPGDYDVHVATAESAAGPWTHIRVSDDPVASGRDQFWPAIAIAPNGRVTVAWYDQRHPGTWSVYATSSGDRGANWGANRQVTDNLGFTPVVSGFIGDYLTVAAVDAYAYVVWMDNRQGNQEIYGARIPGPAPAAPSNLKLPPASPR
jgi:hypothetical protein